MEKLRDNAGIKARTVYGYRVSRFLIVKKQPDLKKIVDTATDGIIAASRAVEDLERPVQEAVADRIIAGDALDDLARLIARRLMARGPRAEQENPYTDILPKGLGDYTEAKQEDEVYQFTRLTERVQEFLPADDADRMELEPQLVDAIDAWKLADESVDAAHSKQDTARQARDAAVVAWTAAIEEAYGLLVARIGKAKAERCFPKSHRPKPAAEAAPAPEAAEAAPVDADDPTPEE